MKQPYILTFNFFKIAIGILFLFELAIPSLRAQQDSQYTQYMYNTNTINPAYAGSQEVLMTTLLYRNQWVGLEGAPKTLNFSAHSQLGRKIGAGISFTSDDIGPSQESTIAADFSYTLSVSEKSKLAFGLKGGINLLNIDYSLLTVFNPNDPQLQQNIDNRLNPLIGAGAYFYNEKFYAGLSVPNVLTTTFYDDITISNAQEKPTLYFITGYVFDLSESWLFKPTFLAKAIEDVPISLDVSANFLYNQTLIIGAAYRFDIAVSALAGIQLSPYILIGYAYDYNTTSFGNYNSGSHEIFLRFSLGNKQDDRLLVPRFF